jgi:hypothetical protein
VCTSTAKLCSSNSGQEALAGNSGGVFDSMPPC